MSKASHTEGPWVQQDTPGYNDTKIVGANGSVVAMVRDGDFDGPLITAAPVMLAALKTAAEIFDDMMRRGVIGESPNYGGYYTGPKALDCIQNAIAKAEGRLP